MHHIAIMKKSWRLTEEILTGQKKIESRWYKTKHAPWGNIAQGDVIYFKNTSEPVSAKAEVEKVISFYDLTPKKVKDILDEYGADDGIEKNKIPEFFKLFKDKRYCLLVYLKNPQKIAPFEIDKTGFGAMSAWITVEDVNKIKKPYQK